MAEKFIKHELEKYKICFFEYQRKSNKNNKRNAKNERKRAKKILQICWAAVVVVVQLVERSLTIREVCSANPLIGKIYIQHLFTVNSIEDECKEKRGRERPILKNVFKFVGLN